MFLKNKLQISTTVRKKDKSHGFFLAEWENNHAYYTNVFFFEYAVARMPENNLG